MNSLVGLINILTLVVCAVIRRAIAARFPITVMTVYVGGWRG